MTTTTTAPPTAEERTRRIRLLLAALRSGRYQQATGALRKGKGYCCLGVGCDVYLQETGNGRWGSHAYVDQPDGEQDWSFAVGLVEEEGALPPLVAEWYFGDPDDTDPDLTFPNEDLDIETTYMSLSALNDNGTPFETIADYIEEQLLPTGPPVPADQQTLPLDGDQ